MSALQGACPTDCAACRPESPVVLRELYDEGVQVGWRVWRRVGDMEFPLGEVITESKATAHREALALLRAARTRL